VRCGSQESLFFGSSIGCYWSTILCVSAEIRCEWSHGYRRFCQGELFPCAVDTVLINQLLEEISRREDLSPSSSSSSPSPTSTLGGVSHIDKYRHAAHVNHHRNQLHPHQHQLPPINGSKHRTHPYRSHSPGSDTRPRLPSPLAQGLFKIPSPPRAYPPTESINGYAPYASSRSPASTGYSATSPGVSAERTTAAI
jgi:hypothetical protein